MNCVHSPRPKENRKGKFCAMNSLERSKGQCALSGLRTSVIPDCGSEHSFHARKSAIIGNYRLSFSSPKPSMVPILNHRIARKAFQPNLSNTPMFAHNRELFRRPLRQNVDSTSSSLPSFPSVRDPNQAGTSHQIPQKVPVFPHFPEKTVELPTSRSRQNVDNFPLLPISALSLQPSSFQSNLPGSRRVSLQKIKFSVSATLKQPPLQMNHLHQFFTETA